MDSKRYEYIQKNPNDKKITNAELQQFVDIAEGRATVDKAPVIKKESPSFLKKAVNYAVKEGSGPIDSAARQAALMAMTIPTAVANTATFGTAPYLLKQAGAPELSQAMLDVDDAASLLESSNPEIPTNRLAGALNFGTGAVTGGALTKIAGPAVRSVAKNTLFQKAITDFKPIKTNSAIGKVVQYAGEDLPSIHASSNFRILKPLPTSAAVGAGFGAGTTLSRNEDATMSDVGEGALLSGALGGLGGTVAHGLIGQPLLRTLGPKETAYLAKNRINIPNRAGMGEVGSAENIQYRINEGGTIKNSGFTRVGSDPSYNAGPMPTTNDPRIPTRTGMGEFSPNMTQETFSGRSPQAPIMSQRASMSAKEESIRLGNEVAKIEKLYNPKVKLPITTKNGQVVPELEGFRMLQDSTKESNYWKEFNKLTNAAYGGNSEIPLAEALAMKHKLNKSVGGMTYDDTRVDVKKAAQKDFLEHMRKATDDIIYSKNPDGSLLFPEAALSNDNLRRSAALKTGTQAILAHESKDPNAVRVGAPPVFDAFGNMVSGDSWSNKIGGAVRDLTYKPRDAIGETLPDFIKEGVIHDVYQGAVPRNMGMPAQIFNEGDRKYDADTGEKIEQAPTQPQGMNMQPNKFFQGNDPVELIKQMKLPRDVNYWINNPAVFTAKIAEVSQGDPEVIKFAQDALSMHPEQLKGIAGNFLKTLPQAFEYDKYNRVNGKIVDDQSKTLATTDIMNDGRLSALEKAQKTSKLNQTGELEYDS